MQGDLFYILKHWRTLMTSQFIITLLYPMVTYMLHGSEQLEILKMNKLTGLFTTLNRQNK